MTMADSWLILVFCFSLFKWIPCQRKRRKVIPLREGNFDSSVSQPRRGKIGTLTGSFTKSPLPGVPPQGMADDRCIRNKTVRQILNENNSPYLYSVSLVVWPFTLMKSTHFSELSISRFSTYIRNAQGWTLHFWTPDLRSEKSQRKMTGRLQIQCRIQAHIL